MVPEIKPETKSNGCDEIFLLRLGRLAMLALLCLSSCSLPIRVVPPSSMLDSPEAMGEAEKTKFGGQLFLSPGLLVTPNVGTIDPNTSAPPVSLDEAVNIYGGISLNDKIELELRFPLHARVKFQFLGDAKKVAELGNFSGAIQAGLGVSKKTNSESNSSSSAQSYSLSEFDQFVGVSFGYRLGKAFLIFGGFHLTSLAYEGKFSVASRSIIDRPFDGSYLSTGPNLGLELGFKRANIRFQIVAEEVKAGQVRNTFIGGGAEFSVYLGGETVVQNDRVARR